MKIRGLSVFSACLLICICAFCAFAEGSVQAVSEALPSKLKMTETVFSGSTVLKDFERKNGLRAGDPDEYVYAGNGIFTFRGDNFRRNASFGTAEIRYANMSVIWKFPLGSISTKDNGVLYGTGWGSQPVVIKWPEEIRNMMALYDGAAGKKALREVIFTCQDGKVYFLDLQTGEQTRDPLNIGYPLKGSVTADPASRPMIAFGQAISKLKNGKTGQIGYYVYSLIDNKQLFFINGRSNDDQKQYSTNGAFDGTGLFLDSAHGDALLIAGENGLLYTANLNTSFDFRKDNTLALSRDIVYLRSKTGSEKEARTTVESSLAMYDRYVYTADGWGILRCTDTDTMKIVWAADCGDNTDAAVALDQDENGGISLYTGNTVFDRLKKAKTCTIRRFNALTGEMIWSYDIACAYDKNEMSGCKASPVIGQNEISDLVIFTVNMTDKGKTSTVLALEKSTGAVRWQKNLDTTAISSPVAVYNQAGEAWIIQADEGGTLHMLDGLTGTQRGTLSLGGSIQSSPAVYRDILVIGTCSKGNAYMYGIKLE